MINYAKQVFLFVSYEHGMDFVPVHDGLNFGDFGSGQHVFWRACHDVAHGVVEEFGLPALHGTTNITVGNEANHFIVF